MSASSPLNLRATIISALDDIAAAVDGLSARFDGLERQVLLLEQRLEEVQEGPKEPPELPEDLRRTLRDINFNIESLGAEIAAVPETLKDYFRETTGPLEDIQEELRRQERQEWRAGLKTTQILKLLA